MASSHSLRLTAIAPRARRSIARPLLIVLTLCAAGTSIAQAPTPQSRAEQEPITPIPAPPVQDPRQVALGDRLFHDPQLSHDNTRSCNSRHNLSTNGTSASSPNSTPDAVELNIPTVFNAAQLDRTLTDDQTNAIVAFLNTLTGTYLGKPVTPAGQLRQTDAPK